jgi:hypothetical protein
VSTRTLCAGRALAYDLDYDERIVSPDNLTVGPNRPKYESSGLHVTAKRPIRGWSIGGGASSIS